MPWFSSTLRRGSRTPRSVKDVSVVTFYCLSGIGGVWAALPRGGQVLQAHGCEIAGRQDRSPRRESLWLIVAGDVLASIPLTLTLTRSIPHQVGQAIACVRTWRTSQTRLRRQLPHRPGPPRTAPAEHVCDVTQSGRVVCPDCANLAATLSLTRTRVKGVQRQCRCEVGKEVSGFRRAPPSSHRRSARECRATAHGRRQAEGAQAKS